MPDNTHNPADYIVPLSINGLEGRILHVPAQQNKHTKGKKREILFVYGHHSTLERWWGLIEVMSEYGDVTMPDMPGFGGMDSFYKIDKKPTIDNMADYMATFIKWRYRRKKVVIVGMSFGFVVATRMLQKYPELTGKVDLLVSIVGFAHYHDFLFSPTRLAMYRLGAAILSHNPAAWLFRHILLAPPILKLAYSHTSNAKHKFEHTKTREEFDQQMATEITLWHNNDVRSQWHTANEFMHLDNTRVRVDLPVWHISSDNDHFFNHTVVEQHLRVIYSDFHDAPVDMPNHAPSVIADAEMAAPLIPESLRKALRELP